jgi:ABC-type glutathione transport system ATPase component
MYILTRPQTGAPEVTRRLVNSDQGEIMLDPTKPQSILIDLRSVCRSFPKGSGEDLAVLEKVDLTIHSGEIVGLLGRSGSGKSTLLRIIAGRAATGRPTLSRYPVSAEVSISASDPNDPARESHRSCSSRAAACPT